jgi:hypothetical protein
LLGLALSIVAHGAALFGLPQPLGEATWGLHVGIFVIGIPTMIIASGVSSEIVGNKLEGVLGRCPPWMRRLVWALFGYAIFNFIVSIPFVPGKGEGGNAWQTPPIAFRLFSGHWMLFYAVFAAVLYYPLAVSRQGSDPR